MSFPFSTQSLNELCSDVSFVATSIDNTYLGRLEKLADNLPILGPRSVIKRRNEFYAGRWCAAKAFEKLTGMIEVPGIQENRAPSWPIGYCGSISHSNEWVISCVASKDSYESVGLDIEDSSLLPNSTDWSAQIATNQELEICSVTAGDDALALIFSAKETLFKAINPLTNVFFDFTDAEVVGRASAGIKLKLLRTLNENYKQSQCFDVQFLRKGTLVLTFLAIAVSE